MTSRLLSEAPDRDAVLNRIGALEFHFDVSDHSHQLGAPEKLLMAVRAELLDVIDTTLTEAARGSEDIRLEQIDIDLGKFPDPPDWSQVRTMLRQCLLTELGPYRISASGTSGTEPALAQSPRTIPGSRKPVRSGDEATRVSTLTEFRSIRDRATPQVIPPGGVGRLSDAGPKGAEKSRKPDTGERADQQEGLAPTVLSFRSVRPMGSENAGVASSGKQSIPPVVGLAEMLLRLRDGRPDANARDALLAQLRWRRRNAPARLSDDLAALSSPELADLLAWVGARDATGLMPPAGHHAHEPGNAHSPKEDLIHEIEHALEDVEPPAVDMQRTTGLASVLRKLFQGTGEIQTSTTRPAQVAKAALRALPTAETPDEVPRGARGDDGASLSRMTGAELRQLIASLLPENATALSEAIDQLDTTAVDPTEARRVVAQALIEGRPVDLDIARRAEIAHASIGEEATALITALLQQLHAPDREISAFLKQRFAPAPHHVGKPNTGTQPIDLLAESSSIEANPDLTARAPETPMTTGDSNPPDAAQPKPQLPFQGGDADTGPTARQGKFPSSANAIVQPSADAGPGANDGESPSLSDTSEQEDRAGAPRPDVAGPGPASDPPKDEAPQVRAPIASAETEHSGRRDNDPNAGGIPNLPLDASAFDPQQPQTYTVPAKDTRETAPKTPSETGDVAGQTPDKGSVSKAQGTPPTSAEIPPKVGKPGETQDWDLRSERSAGTSNDAHVRQRIPTGARTAERRLEVLFEAATPDAARLRDLLNLIWQAMTDDRVSARRDRVRYWQAALTAALTAGGDLPARGSAVAAFLAVIEPDEGLRHTLLRLLRARLGYGQPGTNPALRRETCAVLDTLLAGDQAVPATATPQETYTGFATTARAGLVIFHPYLPMLFDRMALLTADRHILPEELPRAAAVLAALAETNSQIRPPDPLERLLLALPETAECSPEALADGDITLVESLLRSVIAQWPRLGQTSPQGLRDAFVCRSGILQSDGDTPRLLVDEGPFDMLLDGLPWALTPVILPWMSLPLTVIWRAQDD